MTRNEFLKLIQDFASAQIGRSEPWHYHCSSLTTNKLPSGRDEIRIVYVPYKVEPANKNAAANE